MSWYRVTVTVSIPVSAESEQDVVDKAVRMVDGPGHLREAQAVDEVGVGSVLVEEDAVEGMSHSQLVGFLLSTATNGGA